MASDGPSGSGTFGFALLAMLCMALQARAEDRLPPPNWDRELALKTAGMTQNGPELNEWFGMLRRGGGAELLAVIKKYSSDRVLAAPVREKQLFRFTQGLADFAAALIPADLLDFLAAYSPQTLVPHPEDASIAVPLFNIPAAAQGIINGVDRQRGEVRSARLLETNPGAWIPGYLAASTPARAGFIEALDEASVQQMENLKQSALQSLRERPELFAVAGTAALVSADQEALVYLVTHFQGAAMAPLLRSAAGQLSVSEQAILLLAAVESAPAENAALAIALLAPGLYTMPKVTDRMFDLLKDPALGSAAALTLARHPDPEVRLRLNGLSEGHEAVAVRARLALDLSSSDNRQ